MTSLGITDDGLVVPVIMLGIGEKSVLYTGCDEYGTGLLLRFCEEYCAIYSRRGVTYGSSSAFLFNSRSLILIPYAPHVKDDGYIDGILQNYLCFNDRIKLYLDIGAGNRCITSCKSDESQALERQISKMTGIRDVRDADGLVRHAAEDCEKKAFGIFAGDCSGKKFYSAYFSIRELLFRSQMMI